MLHKKALENKISKMTKEERDTPVVIYKEPVPDVIYTTNGCYKIKINPYDFYARLKNYDNITVETIHNWEVVGVLEFIG